MLLYTTGTINEPDAGSVGLSMAEKIRDDLIAHAAWDLVEEFTPGGGAVRWYVFKCLATESGLASDFFVVMGRTLANGELRFALCEEYNSTTHVMSFFGHNVSGTTYLYDAQGRKTNTFTLSTTAFSTTNGEPHYHTWVPGGISTKWWLCVDDDGFTVAFNGAANAFVHIGAYEPLAALPVDLPIQSIGSSSAIGDITRNPAVGGINTSGYALGIAGGGSTAQTGPVLGFQGSMKNNDKLQSNQRSVAEQGIAMYPGMSDFEPIYGWALGKQKRMRLGASGSTPAGFAFGDAYALDGTLWVPYLPTDWRIWDTGVAS